MMLDKAELDLLRDALATLDDGFAALPAFEQNVDHDAIATVLGEVAKRMHDNFPYFHPMYAGQMLKPPHPVARLAYAMSLWINPNNHALDGGRASSALEKECIVELGRMFGFEKPLGHLTGGGTMANLEALWVAGRLQPGKRVVASSLAHYTHKRICDVLGIPFTAIRTRPDGEMDIAHLEELLAAGDVGMVVATMGSTGFGYVDPLPTILELREQHGFRVHADAAYGGYFTLAESVRPEVQQSYQCLEHVNSIVIDPHKHGLQPYGCGCVLFRDPADGRFYKHDSPFTYFSSDELHLGEISLECSRPGAAAVALWATHRLLPPVPGGAFAADLDRCLHAAQEFHAQLSDSELFHPIMAPDLDIVVYAADASDTAEASKRASAIFDFAAEEDLHLALIDLPSAIITHFIPEMTAESETVTCLRSVLMKPEHIDWLGPIMEILERAATRAAKA